MSDPIRKFALRLRLDTKSRAIREDLESVTELLRLLGELAELDVDIGDAFGTGEEEQLAAAQTLIATLLSFDKDVVRTALEEFAAPERAVLSGVEHPA